ncbi:hypothetical protein Trydic_g6991 [Trypoxylus dichotomus]
MDMTPRLDSLCSTIRDGFTYVDRQTWAKTLRVHADTHFPGSTRVLRSSTQRPTNDVAHTRGHIQRPCHVHAHAIHRNEKKRRMRELPTLVVTSAL